MDDDGAERQREIERTAAEWLIRLGGEPLKAAEKAAFEAWLAADPAHRPAFEAVQAAWAGLDVLKEKPGPLRKVIATPEKKKPRRRDLLVVFGLLAIGLAVARYQIGDPWIAWAADYRTTAGETRRVLLPDGSFVEIGPESAIALDFTDRQRGIRLLAGEAYFNVAHQRGGEPRRFVVSSVGGTTMALGTRFNVDDVGEEAVVTAIESRIEVAAASGRVVLSPGDTVRYDSKGSLGAVEKIDIANAAAWRQGTLVFDSVPLGQVVARLNRYRRGHIAIMSRSLAERRVSGVFPTSRLDDVIGTITGELGARSVSVTPLLTVIY